MLAKDEAQNLLEKALPDVPVKAWSRYRNLYLFRVQWPFEGEEDFDPFVSVNSETGEVRDFSVMTDGDISEIGALVWNDV
jgi:hypothetical protein